MLFTHTRGGASDLSKTSYCSARIEGRTNIKRRVQCWEIYEALQRPLTGEDEDLLAICSDREVDDLVSQGGHGSRAIPFVDLLPRFMELSAQFTQLTETRVSEIWLRLAAEFMLQAACEEGFNGPTDYVEVHHDMLLACFGWGLPMDVIDLARSMDGVDAKWAASERTIHKMLRSSKGEGSSRSGSWDYHRTRAISYLLEHIHMKDPGAQHAAWERGERPYSFEQLHPTQAFENRVVDYVKNLQIVWAQMNEEPILLQIEQGRLEGLDDSEFRAFMDMVGSDEREERLQSIMVPGSSKI